MHTEYADDVFGEVPVLPVVVPGAIALSGALVWWLRRTGRLTGPRAAVAIAIGVYAGGIVANTVFPIYRDKPTSDAPWDAHLVLAPWAEYEATDAVMNMAVFVPLGLLVALMSARSSWWRALVVVALCSAAIEGAQFVTAHSYAGGHVADIHDLIFNVVGGAVGAAAVWAASRTPAAPVVDRFRWSTARPGGEPAASGSPARGPSRTT